MRIEHVWEGACLADSFIVEKDGKKYVYRSTSVYDPHTKRKRTVSEYLGKLDPVTGELIEKKSRTRPGSTPQGNNVVRNYGACHALVSIAESCGLRDDLFRSFGQEGDYLLAESISLILTGGPMYYLEPEIETNMSRELLGFGNSLSAEELLERVRCIGDDPNRVETLFRKRAGRVSSVALFGRAYIQKPESEFGWIDRGTGTSKESNYCIATDMDGIPVFFEPCYDVMLDSGSVDRLVNRLIGFGAEESVAILDSDSGDAESLSDLVSKGVDFVVPAKKKTPAIKQMLSEVVKKRKDPRSLRRFGEDNFIVYDTEMGIVSRKNRKRPEFPEDDIETADLELVSMTDLRLQDVPLNDRMVAWACLEIGDCSENNRDSMNEKLESISARLIDMDPYDAVDTLREIAGEYARFFDAKVVEGELELKIRQKAVTASLNREGIFVILSHGVRNWNSVMECYECRNRYENIMKILRTNLISGTLGEPGGLVDTMLTRFVSLVLWCTAEKRLRESDIDLPVSTVMQLLDTVMATGDGTSWQITEVTPRSRRLFEALHVPIPRPQISSLPYDYRPGNYDFNKMNDRNGREDR